MKNKLYYVERLVIEVKDDNQQSFLDNSSKPLADYRNVERYVLLGEPGAGKTTAFEHEAKHLESNAAIVTAKIFIEWQHNEHEGKTLFIDGLDEAVAISGNRTPLSEVRKQLRRFNIQKYRISCRAADWNGKGDKNDFASVNGNIIELHLQGLNEENIKNILQNDNRVNDAADFYQQAEANQLGNFLSNPQTLDMLIEATEGGVNWLSNKQELYQKTSEVLSRENNPEHADSPASRFLTEELLEAAGELYAYMLIANSQSFNITESDEKDTISLPKLGIKKDQPHYEALRRRLFNQITSTSFNPIHRSVAEFLAAKYLANRLKQGVSLRRCFALITGFDGGPVAALRGLYAWLGTLSIQAREKVIETDVLGLVQYGDVSSFSLSEKIKVIDALILHISKLGHLNYRDDKGFAGLISEEMLPELKTILSTSDYANPHQELLTAILDGLRNSKPQIELKALILEIIKDSKNSHQVRWRALDVFIGFDDIPSLLSLADAIKTSTIEDNSDELMGQLLKRLFPDNIAASKIFDYLKTDSKSGGINEYRYFWEYNFLTLVNEGDIPELLDNLAKIDVKQLYYGKHGSLSRMVGGLVNRGLKLFGNEVEAERLYTWLNIGLDPETGSIYSYDTERNAEKIKLWLEENPEVYKNVLKVTLSKIEDPEKFYLHRDCLWRANPPADIGSWWLEQSLEASNIKIKNDCFLEAYYAFKRDGFIEVNQAILDRHTEQHNEFKTIYTQLNTPSKYHQIHEDNNLKWKEKHEAEVRNRLDYFQSQKSALLNGNAPPNALHHLASAYFDHYPDVNGKTGLERLEKYLDHNQALIDAAITGIYKTLERTDLPTVQEVFELSIEGKIHYLQLPALTAIEKRYNESLDFIASLSDEIAQRALAYWLCYGAGNQPAWVKPLMLQRPELSSQVLINYMTTMLKNKVARIHGYYQLAHDEDLAEIAKRVVIPVLSKFPTKSPSDNRSILEALLKTAIYYVSRDELLNLIAQKLKRSSLDVLQKIYLLATGLVIAPEQYESKVMKEVTTLERANYLSGFLYEAWCSNYKPMRLEPSTIELLISLIAPLASPRWPNQGSDGDFVQSLINKLSETPHHEIGYIFERLLQKKELSRWFSTLKSAQQKYLLNRREAEFRHPTPNEVVETIQQTRPANVADLSAMVFDFLDDLQRDMRTTNTDNYLQFWNVDSYGKPLKYRPENICRGYLADKLNDKYKAQGVQINPEALAAESKRVDIRLTYSDSEKNLNLPVEIKCNFNQELWTAIHQQLIPKYTNEHNTQGRGIYLVLWFGAEFNVTAKDSGNKPKTASELQTRLIATMTPDLQKLIEVFVLDVSKPS